MEFFENLGRKVEEFKRTAEDAAAEGAVYVCDSCGEQFHHDHDECPSCGAAEIVSRESSSNPDDATGDGRTDAGGASEGVETGSGVGETGSGDDETSVNATIESEKRDDDRR